LKNIELEPGKKEDFRIFGNKGAESCKTQCKRFHRYTYYLIRKDRFLCRCMTTWYDSKQGNSWTELSDDEQKLWAKDVEKAGVAVVIN